MSVAERIDYPAHLGRITPVVPVARGKVLNLASLIMHAGAVILFQSGWMLLGLLGFYATSLSGPLGGTLMLAAAAWLCLQFALVFLYPEWPLNRLLCWRLRQNVLHRASSLVDPEDPGIRVVELVPRDRWRKLSLETATDMMLMRVDDDGVWMTGDRDEYALPKESILGAQLQSTTPPGWFTATHMVILVVRTDQGPVELPISYRDHSFRTLRSAKRCAEAAELAQRIETLAEGHQYQAPHAPVVATPPRVAPPSGNPYASPALLDDRR